MAKYAIWDKVSPIITPIGEVLTPEQWINRYPMAGLDSITVVCAAGEINGGFFGTIGQMKQLYEEQNCDFSACTTDQEILNAIEAFDLQKEEEAKLAAEVKLEAEAEALATQQSIAASLEYQNMMNY